ncbi:hypothetical protein N7532_005887 [Penicillium argentinense]|uniref:Zn(2)-C6 fungal-type domain-containing protein n=1 Tax=Penicillium argentinense TaxID=1131581 RepID=A0A9W9FEV1_9EURO|nr:uncharacterized protein N7532_005887 [Penicillium argentinense]KAJ5098886.1 hypothetical protein N7532_005887 [Penicillium argentinense]
MPPESDRKLACLVCRHRKVACDRRRPRCGLCDKNGFECEYKARDHRPGLRAGYVSQLEKRVEDLERKMEKVVGRLSEEPSHTQTETNNVSSTIREPPTLDFGNAETLRTPQSNAVRMETDPSPLVASPQDLLIEPLRYELQMVWLQRYHPWFPILHHTSVSQAFSEATSTQCLLRKAIEAVTIWDIPGITWEQKQISSTTLRQEVISSAMESLNLRCIQALLILSILFWGEGKWLPYSNLTAMCQRLSQQLSLPTVAGVARAQPSKMSTRDAATSQPEIDHEERLRTFWMIEMLDSIFALGFTSNLSTSKIPLGAKFPCSDSIWALQDPFREGVSFQNLRYSSGLSMCISLCTVELGAVHRFQQSVAETDGAAGGLEWQSAAQRLDERLTIWREEFVAAVFRLINTESPQDARAEMEIFIVLTNCVLNMGVITLLQSQTSLPDGVGSQTDSWPYANHRCMYACENMAAKIRRMEEDELKNCSPCLILPIFVAARFYIVHTKCLRADVSVNLHSLAYSLHICGHRWPLAKMFESVIRTAVAEHRTPIPQSALPIEFYDLRFSVVEICHILQEWSDSYSSPVLHSV